MLLFVLLTDTLDLNPGNILLLLQYVISRSDDDSKTSVVVKILDKLTQTW